MNTHLARRPIIADPRLDSRLVELPGTGGESLTPEDPMQDFHELLHLGDYAAARRHPNYLKIPDMGERIVAAAQLRHKELCGQHNGISSMPPRIGGDAIDASRVKQMEASADEKKRIEERHQRNTSTPDERSER